MTAVLQVERLTKNFGGLRATDDVSLEVPRGELHAIIGPNGAGKTTLMSLITGELKADAGDVRLNGRSLTGLPPHRRAKAGLGRSFQITNLAKSHTVRQNMALALIGRQATGVARGFLRNVITDAGQRRDCDAWLETFELTPEAETAVGNLSHGEQRQLELALALASEPELLLLDEPMAGLGREETIAMTERLRTLKRRQTILLVEHDMEAVFALADRVTVLVNGAVLTIDTPEAVRANAQVRDVYLGTETMDAADAPA
ncbi:MAG: ABC transporter ATP-binding protein [Pseudomonadota bacterium]